MFFFTNFVCKKINETPGLTLEEKKVLSNEYKKGNISISELTKAKNNSQKQEGLKARCREEVLSAYYEYNSIGINSVIKRKNGAYYGYKPIDAEFFWKTIATKQGYKMQEHFCGRCRILTEDGYWVKSGKKEEIESLFIKLC